MNTCSLIYRRVHLVRRDRWVLLDQQEVPAKGVKLALLDHADHRAHLVLRVKLDDPDQLVSIIECCCLFGGFQLFVSWFLN